MTNLVGKNKQGYGYQYTDIAQIHKYLETMEMTYYQYIDRIDGDDYVMTVKVDKDGKESAPLRGSRVVQATLSGIKNPAQEQGSALTYARRYSLLLAFGLATTDDDAASLTIKEPVDDIKDLLQELEELVIDTGADLEKIKEYYKVKKTTDMSSEQLKNAIKVLKKKGN